MRVYVCAASADAIWTSPEDHPSTQARGMLQAALRLPKVKAEIRRRARPASCLAGPKDAPKMSS
jgi:hypothetical protein